MPGSVVASLTRYWTNRPGGEATLAAAGSVCSGDQSDQVSSGSPTFPVRAWTATDVPGGCSARQLSAPNRLTSLVSWTSETRRPAVANCAGEPDHARPGRRSR